MDEQYLKTLERIEKVRREVERWLAESPPNLPPFGESEASEHMDRAMDHCEKAEKLLAEGRVLEAAREEAKCVKEMGEARSSQP